MAGDNDRSPHSTKEYSPSAPTPPPPEPAKPPRVEQVDQISRLSGNDDKYATRSDPKKGGMAVVWKAYDSTLNREVAFKELKNELLESPMYRNMFLYEAQITGQLEHPNIIPIYELGRDTPDRQPYYTMKYVRGSTLSELIGQYHARLRQGQSDPLELSRLLGIFTTICNAIGYAHSRGVVHRDLKPDNVMVGSFGDVVVLDWGLAKCLGTSESDLPAVSVTQTDVQHTQVGSRVGTPAYWAPEQAKGETGQVDSRTDIYGLGAILFDILAGRAPHAREETDSGKPQTTDPEAIRPREVEPSVPAPLDAICAKAMAPRRKDRYAKAAELAEDIQRFLIDEPVAAYRETWPERMQRFARRYRTAVMVGSVGATALILVGALIAFLQYSNRRQLTDQELKRLSQFANVEGTRVTAHVDNLRQDVTFLGNLADTQAALREPGAGPKNGGKAPKAATALPQAKAKAGGTVHDGPKLRLSRVFEELLKERLDYMQIRLLDENGIEQVRVERKVPRAKPEIVFADTPQDKRDRTYFKETMKTKAGGWYLSRVELNQEHNKKQPDVPVIRGAVPVFLTEKKQGKQEKGNVSLLPAGIVVINLHFRELIRNLRNFQSDTAGLVYLTDEEGQFLYQHNSELLAFCFERGLEYRIQQLYPVVGRLLDSGTISETVEESSPQNAVHIRPARLRRMTREQDIQFIQTQFAQKLELARRSLEKEYPRLKLKLSDQGDAVVYGVEKDELAKVTRQIEQQCGLQLETQSLPQHYGDEDHTLYFHRLDLSFGENDRYLGFALVLPDQALSGESTGSGILWATMAVILLAAAAGIYFAVRSQTKRRGA